MKKSKKTRTLIKAAKMGKVNAQYALALAYWEGYYLPQDEELALAWMNVAADNGSQDAEEWLSDYYFDDDPAVQAYA